MAQPPAYTRQADFSDYSSNNPGTAHSGTSLDAEFDALRTTITAVLTNLGLIQDDDGDLARGSVGIDQLASDVEMGFRTITNWTTATAYRLRDGVFKDGVLYRCIVRHTSGTFADDLTAAYWVVVFDLVGQTETAIALADISSGQVTATGSTTARTLAARFSDYVVYAKDHGVTADGATDDAEALQAAIDAAFDAGGGMVVLPAGVCRIEDAVTIKDKVSLVGSGTKATRITQASSAHGLLIDTNAGHIVIRDIWLYGPSTTNGDHHAIAFLTGASNVLIDNVRIENWPGEGVNVVTGSNVCVTRNHISTCRAGVVVFKGCARVVISDNVVRSIRTNGISIDDATTADTSGTADPNDQVIVHGNHVEAASQEGSSSGILCSGSNFVSITSNIVLNSGVIGADAGSSASGIGISVNSGQADYNVSNCVAVSDNIVSGCAGGPGLRVEGATNVSIEANTLYDNWMWPATLSTTPEIYVLHDGTNTSAHFVIAGNFLRKSSATNARADTGISIGASITKVTLGANHIFGFTNRVTIGATASEVSEMRAGSVMQIANGASGVDTTLRTLEDGFGTDSALSLSTTQVGAAAGSASAPGITFSGDANTGFFSAAADAIGVALGGSSAMRFETTGFGIGTLASQWGYNLATFGAGITAIRQSDTAGSSPALAFQRLRASGNLAVQSGDTIGVVQAIGYDSGAYRVFADILFQADGTVGSGDAPGRVIIRVTPDGSATPETAITLSNSKAVAFAGAVSVNGSATLGDGAADTLTVNAGAISAPNIPAVSAYVSDGSQTNVTGDGTAYTVIFDTENYDQGSNYNNATGVFTAPASGIYAVNAAVRIGGLTVNNTRGYIAIITSNQSFFFQENNPFAVKSSDPRHGYQGSMDVYMDAGDTCSITVAVEATDKGVDIEPAAYLSIRKVA